MPRTATPIRMTTRLQGRLWPILQTAIAATVAWYLAVLLLPDGRPSFASIAAVICLGASYGQRGSKSLQLVGGVVLGICVASAIVALIGTGSLQIGLMVVLAMTAAVLLRGGELLTAEAAVSAILLVSLDPSTSDVSFTLNRVFEALIGGSRRAGRVRAGVPAQPGAARRARGAGRVRRPRWRAGAARDRARARRHGARPRGAGRGARARQHRPGVQRHARDRARHGAALAAAQDGRGPRSTATPRVSPRSTSRSATRACSRGIRCGCCARAGRSRRRCRTRSVSSASRSGRWRARTTSPSAPTRSARTRRAPASLAGEGPTEVLAQIRSTAVDLRRAADLTRDPGLARPEAPTEELLATL